ncbi:MAG TPA: TIGR03435 family protein [Bryobacteraceae bacterium]
MRILVGLLIGGFLAAQPAFEVASLRPTTPNGLACSVFTYPGGRVVVHNCTVPYIIAQSFDEEKVVIPDAAAWTNENRYDIEARPPANSESAKSNPFNIKLPPNEEQRLMLQALFADRFQMKFHRETKEEDVFLLKTGKALKLQGPKDTKAYPWAGQYSDPDVFAGMNITMPQLVKRLTRMLGRPVLDQTGLSGAFDFKSPYDATGEHPDRMTFLIGSLNALGLKLESSKAPIERIMVDHLEKPTANE